MDRGKAKILDSILKDSSLYQTMSNEEKISLFLRLEKDYPFLFADSDDDNEEGEAV